MSALRGACIALIDALYSLFARLILFRFSAQRGHDLARGLLRMIDRIPFAYALAAFCRSVLVARQPTSVGGVVLSQRLILAAGILKGSPDSSQAREHESRMTRTHAIPGWRFVPALAGPVEFGSFTRHPRDGNSGRVTWRTEKTRSTQNRIGLRNVGARDAARFLAQRRKAGRLATEFGINIAVSPGVTDIDQQEREIIESLTFFLDAGVYPRWFTLNISCPNTEDDPQGNQLEAETRQLCAGFVDCLASRSLDIPLWVKIGPGLAAEQYRALLRIFDETGVKAVIATNTFAKPTPDDARVPAGVGGGELFAKALAAVRQLMAEKKRKGYALDIIACGGILDGASLRAYEESGVKAAQYWSALVYRGPFAAAIIEQEYAQLKRRPKPETFQRESLA